MCCGGLRPLPEDGVGEIKRMFVTAPARRRGHGRALLAELERLAAAGGCRHVRLFTTEVLVEARALYESAGYRVVGTVPDGDRTDIWLEKRSRAASTMPVPPRARSSVGERSLHTREVAGSKPAAPIVDGPPIAGSSCLGG